MVKLEICNSKGRKMSVIKTKRQIKCIRDGVLPPKMCVYVCVCAVQRFGDLSRVYSDVLTYLSSIFTFTCCFALTVHNLFLSTSVNLFWPIYLNFMRFLHLLPLCCLLVVLLLLWFNVHQKAPQSLVLLEFNTIARLCYWVSITFWQSGNNTACNQIQ